MLSEPSQVPDRSGKGDRSRRMRASVRNVVAVLVTGTWLWVYAIATSATPAANARAPTPADASTHAEFLVRPVSKDWSVSLPRSADMATQAYLDRLPVEVVARSNAYFEGACWLQLWNLLLGLGIALFLLEGRRAARLRDWAERVSGRPLLRDAVFGAIYATAAWLLSLPLTVYQGYFREHQYGMATQSLGPWFGEQLIGLALTIVMFALGAAVFYAVLRRVGARWWPWATLVAVAFLVLLVLVAPVVVDPLFNTYKPVAEGPVRDAVLAMARANGVPAENIHEFDASRQTTRVSANVSGLFGSASIRLNDNLLRRSTLPEIRAVMAHEMGHYVLNHVYKLLAAASLLLWAGFVFAQWAMSRLLTLFGHRLGLRGVSDVASFPLLVAVFSVLAFAATPITNTIIRTHEVEADRFGLNLAREPHGAAEVYLKLTEYRKPDPTPLEEFVFFDHPSTRFRIHDAMRWREAMGAP
jgi:STE24 endopeptidase